MFQAPTIRNYQIFVILNLLLSFIMLNTLRLVLAKINLNANIFNDDGSLKTFDDISNRTLSNCGTCPCLCVCKRSFACCNEMAYEDENCLKCWGLEGNCSKCAKGKTLVDNKCTENPGCNRIKNAKCMKCEPGKTLRANGICATDTNCKAKAFTNRECEDGFNKECHKGGCLNCKDGYVMDENWECKQITNEPTRSPAMAPSMNINKWPTRNPTPKPTNKPALKLV